jgi:hypothetical protein
MKGLLFNRAKMSPRRNVACAEMSLAPKCHVPPINTHCLSCVTNGRTGDLGVSFFGKDIVG